MDESECRNIFKQVASAVNHLHTKALVHVGLELNIIEQVHSRKPMGSHFDVIVDIIFEDIYTPKHWWYIVTSRMRMWFLMERDGSS
jgi:serine/threonine protein kinase